MNGGWIHPRENTDIVIGRDTSDSAAVLAVEPDDTLRTALALVRDEYSAPVVAVGRDGVPVSLAVARRSTLASVEVWNARDSVAGRDRMWLDLVEESSDEFGISDMLLLTSSDSLPVSLHDAIPLTRANHRIGSAERLGLFWEVYRVGDGRETLQFELSVMKVGKSFLRRAAEWAGIVGPRADIVRLRWAEEVAGSSSITAHSVGVQLKDFMSGEYAVTLSVRRASGEEKNAVRHVVVR
jgi:hypothetical protein